MFGRAAISLVWRAATDATQHGWQWIDRGYGVAGILIISDYFLLTKDLLISWVIGYGCNGGVLD